METEEEEELRAVREWQDDGSKGRVLLRRSEQEHVVVWIAPRDIRSVEHAHHVCSESHMAGLDDKEDHGGVVKGELSLVHVPALVTWVLQPLAFVGSSANLDVTVGGTEWGPRLYWLSEACTFRLVIPAPPKSFLFLPISCPLAELSLGRSMYE